MTKKLKAKIAVEDCYSGTVEVLEMNKEGLRYSTEGLTCVYEANGQRVSGPENSIKWEDEEFWLEDLFYESLIVDPVIYNLIVLLSEARGQDVNDNEFKDFVCYGTGLTKDIYDDALIGAVRIESVDLYEDIYDELYDGSDSIENRKEITRAFGRYLQLLQEAEEDRASDNAKRSFYALSKEECIKKGCNNDKICLN